MKYLNVPIYVFVRTGTIIQLLIDPAPYSLLRGPMWRMPRSATAKAARTAGLPPDAAAHHHVPYCTYAQPT
jgi:hypothetical protein